MRYLYLVVGIIGLILASYGFCVTVDESNEEQKSKTAWKTLYLLIGLILMVLGLLLYGVPHFFSSS